MSRGIDARLATVRALEEVLNEGRFLGECRSLNLPSDSRDRAYARHLAYGVLRWKSALQWLTNHLLDRPMKARDRDIQRVLWLGLFQLWRDDTADHAAVHATANTARALGKPWATGLINACLRRFLRERDQLLDALGEAEERFAHPPWLLGMLRKDWPDHWRHIIDGNNQPAPFWLRQNASSGNREKDQGRLRERSFTVTAHPEIPGALALDPPAPVNEIPGFAQGRFSVQDVASQRAAHLLQLEPGQRLLDACAAPGGKTGHALELCPGIAITALDRDAARLEKVRENLDRIGTTAHLLAADAGDPDQWWDGKPFQRILLDAPCSATGVIRRHPEIKWLRTPEQVAQACVDQQRLLERLWPLLEPGGILVYATCSVLKRENSHQIVQFLQGNDDALCEGPSGFGLGLSRGRQLLPGMAQGDGFYYAVLHKRA